MLEIREVKSASDIKEFIEFPLRLYRDCPYFVPPLYSDEKKLLKSSGKTADSDAVFFLAVRGGITVGRIQGILQKEYNRSHGTRQIRFTRFDCIDDFEVARELFSAVEKWGRALGMTEICGPLGYTDLDREGLLVEGFTENSTFEEQYNYEYYGRLVERLGYEKDVDWLEYELKKPEKRNEMLSRVAKRSLELNKLHIVNAEKMSKKEYIAKYRDGLFECIDRCYSHLYGTMALSKETQDELIDQFMLVLNKEFLVIICDESDRVVGFGLCLPGIGDALKQSDGRLTPAALVRLLKTVRSPRVMDLALVAVMPEYRNAGINAILIDGILDILERGAVDSCETNLNLETNTAVQAQWKYFSARQHKRRRAYIKRIGD